MLAPESSESSAGGGVVAPIALAALSLLGNEFVWFVPGVALGVPGVLLVLLLLVQAIGGAVWVPITRRLLGRDRRVYASADRMWWET